MTVVEPVERPMSREVFDRAAQLHQAGRLEEAEHLYRSLLTGKARPVPVLVNLAALLAGRGDASEGRRCLEEAAKLAPALHPVHGNLAELALALGDAEAAELHWSRALALAPDHVSYRSRRGEALCRLARYGEAIDCLRAALSANPSDAKTLTNLGIALRRDGQTEEAIEVLEQAVDRAPDLAAAQNALGLALYDAAARFTAISATAFELKAASMRRSQPTKRAWRSRPPRASCA